jgi:hypothetical protein
VFSRNFLFCVFLGARFPTVSTFSVNRWFYFSLALERPREACGFTLTHYRPKTQQAKGFTGAHRFRVKLRRRRADRMERHGEERFNLELKQAHFWRILPLCPLPFATLEIETQRRPPSSRAFSF